MCPERSILSAYLDGELEGSCSRTVEQHLGQCESCRSALSRLRELRGRLHAGQEPDLVDAMVRVRNRLDSSKLALEGGGGRRWHRGVSLPLPLAVAAAALLLAMAGALVFSLVRRADTSTVRFTASPTGIRQVEIEGTPQDVRMLLGLLNTDGSDLSVVFEIPSGLRLAPLGEPEVRPAVDRVWPW